MFLLTNYTLVVPSNSAEEKSKHCKGRNEHKRVCGHVVNLTFSQ